MRDQRLWIGHNIFFDIGALARQTGFAKGGFLHGKFSMRLCDCVGNGTCWKHGNVCAKYLGPHKFAYKISCMPANKDGKTEEQYIQDADENLAERPMHILDTLTLAKALYGMESPGSLSALCERHRTKHRKLETEHDQELTFQYLRYTMRDVQCTFELYQKLRATYKRKGLPRPITSIYSAASIGKGYLEKLGVVPFLNLPSQPEQTTCRA